MEFDFHVHSMYSRDSLLHPLKILKIAKRKGLQGIAITDHNTIRGALKTMSLTNDELMVVIGSEIRTNKGDVIGLFIQDEVKSRRFTDVITEIKDQGGIVVLPHPYKNKVNPQELLGNVDIVEGLNARVPKELNYKAQLLAKKFNIPTIAGSDAHLSIEIGQVRTIFHKTPTDIEDIKKDLLNGKTMIKGRESPYYVRMLSILSGKYKTDGVTGIIKATMDKMISRI